jgi:hypothetical protein
MGYKLTKQNDDETRSNGLFGLPSASDKNREDATLVSEWYTSHFNSDDMSAFEGVECAVVDNLLDDLLLGDSDSFRLLSTPEQNDASRKRNLFHDGADDEDIDYKLRQMHDKRARKEASLFASPPGQQHNALQELRRKRPVCLFVNFLGTRCPQEENSKLLSSTTVNTRETRVSPSLKDSEFPESEPSDLPTKSVSSMTTVPNKLNAPSPLLVTPEGLRMLEALGLSICPCKMNKKHSTMSFQTSEDLSVASCCFPALPLAPRA